MGIGALYTRFPSKDALLGHLCLDGLTTFIATAERALTSEHPMAAWVTFLHELLDAQTPALTVRLSGLFTPTPEHERLARRADTLGRQVFAAASATGDIRCDVAYLDVDYLLQLISLTVIGDEERTRAIRHRQLAIVIDGLTTTPRNSLPGTPPTPAEQAAQWRPEPT